MIYLLTTSPPIYLISVILQAQFELHMYSKVTGLSYIQKQNALEQYVRANSHPKGASNAAIDCIGGYC